jgi:hypothetical protein
VARQDAEPEARTWSKRQQDIAFTKTEQARREGTCCLLRFGEERGHLRPRPSNHRSLLRTKGLRIGGAFWEGMSFSHSRCHLGENEPCGKFVARQTDHGVEETVDGPRWLRSDSKTQLGGGCRRLRGRSMSGCTRVKPRAKGSGRGWTASYPRGALGLRDAAWCRRRGAGGHADRGRQLRLHDQHRPPAQPHAEPVRVRQLGEHCQDPDP